jgi:hypothetical protein
MTAYRDRLNAGVYEKAKPTKAALEKAEAAAEARAANATTSDKLAGTTGGKTKSK